MAAEASVLFASWDAEEFALTSSTEWGEQHERWLRDRAVAYLNVDSAASGSQLRRRGRAVSDARASPKRPRPSAIRWRVPVAAAARARGAAGPRPSRGVTRRRVVDDRLGGGSDYAVFLNLLGVPAADLAFDGPYGVYHSVYDTHEFVARFADPGFSLHDDAGQGAGDRRPCG